MIQLSWRLKFCPTISILLLCKISSVFKTTFNSLLCNSNNWVQTLSVSASHLTSLFGGWCKCSASCNSGLVPALRLNLPGLLLASTKPQKILKASENKLMNFSKWSRHLQHLEKLSFFSWKCCRSQPRHEQLITWKKKCWLQFPSNKSVILANKSICMHNSTVITITQKPSHRTQRKLYSHKKRKQRVGFKLTCQICIYLPPPLYLFVGDSFVWH